MKHLIFRVPEEVVAAYHTPGQYVILSRGEEKSFFAIASEPGADRLHLLVKDQEGLAAHICRLEAGDEIECSPAGGNGFRLNDGLDTHLFSMGSGVSPFRSLIEHHLRGAFKPAGLTIWQGALNRDHLPFAEDFARWEEQGVRVKYCFDGGDSAAENVQQRLKREAPDLTGSLCFWIGSKEFGAQVEATAIELGLSPDDYRTNH